MIIYRDLTVPEATLKFAMQFIGLQEIVGAKHNLLMVFMFYK